MRRVYLDHVTDVSEVDGFRKAGLFVRHFLRRPPNGLDDISKMPALIAVLLERGYKERDVKKILGENTLRVIREVTGK